MKFQVFASIIIGIGFVFEGVIAKLTVKEPTVRFFRRKKF